MTVVASGTMKVHGPASIQQPNPRGSRRTDHGRNHKYGPTYGTVPFLVIVITAVAVVSFYSSMFAVPADENDPLFSSLRDFQFSSRQRKPKKQQQQQQQQKTRTVHDVHTNDYEDGERGKFSIDEGEEPMPNPPRLPDGNATFGACLLVMDDNHRLGEWLAYHYHVLPLRYLIIAVDPRSRTSPTRVLNRWRAMGMHVEEWSDDKFLRPDIIKNAVPDDAELQIKRDRHRVRQKNFYRHCLQTMKNRGRTWVTLIDTDEFLMYNHRSVSTEEYERWDQQLAAKYPHKQRIRLSQPPPSPAEAGGLIKYLHREQSAGTPYFQRVCISAPRLQFGSKESTEEERSKNVPQNIINAERLDTLRYRKHAPRQDFVKNGLSKSIVDVSRVDKFPRIESLHRPIKTLCTPPWKDEWDSGLRVNHYLGSWEAYSFRDDSRRGGERSFEGWAFKAKDADETDDNIRPWIGGFVETHGTKKAKELLHGSGLPKGYKGTDGKNWTIMFLDEILGMNETTGNDVRVQFDNFVRDMHLNKKEAIQDILKDIT